MGSDETFEQLQDVLQNIEFAIVNVHRAHPDLLDYHVEDALGALIADYVAEQRGREARRVLLREQRELVYEAVNGICEWRLGRRSSPFDQALAEAAGDPEPRTLEEILASLKRVQKSVRRRNKQGGRQGYLTFIRRYVG